MISGTWEPVVPIECQRDIAATIAPELLTYREFESMALSRMRLTMRCRSSRSFT